MISTILLQGQGGAGSMVMFALIFIVFYFFIIRPQQKKAKEADKYREEIKKGSLIVTNSGLHGKIVNVEGNQFIIDFNGSKMKVEKTAISMELTKANYPDNSAIEPAKTETKSED